MDVLREDCMFSEILEQRKTLNGFLDAVFGFLSRKTDFYHIQKTKDGKLGFPPGIKEQIVMSSIQKYEKGAAVPTLAMNSDDVPPPAVEEVEIESCEFISEIETPVDVIVPDIVQSTAKMPEVVFHPNDYKNGADCGKYCWSQSLKDIEVSVQLPTEVKSAKHIKLDVTSNHISIKALVPNEMELLCDNTWDRYRHNDILWTIADGKLTLSFDKSKECWWDKLLIHESSIDIKKLDTERPINDYSEETQRAIEKIELEEISKKKEGDLKSLPMSKSEQLARLRKAWDAEDSPFKGQPFDPSVIQFN